jgi:hypothetical protein
MNFRKKKKIWFVVGVLAAILTWGAVRPYIESDNSPQERPTIFGIKWSIDW